MTDFEMAQRRLHNQQISSPSLKTPAAVVSWMGAVQAQDYLAALWAIGLRTAHAEAIDEPAVEQAVAERKIVRTWPMRGTLHFVAAEDARWMLRLLTPRVIRSSASCYRELELDEQVFTKSRNILEQAMQGNKQLTRTEIYPLFESAGISTHSQRGLHILGYLAQTAVLCFGTRQGKQHTFCLLDEWVQTSRELSGEEALAELAARYIKSHGPATAHDFSAWTGLTITDARKALNMVTNGVAQVAVNGQTYWLPDHGIDFKTTAASTYLLPAFDEMLCGYRDRSAILDLEFLKTIILRNGILMPTIILNGRVVGSWKRTLKKEQVVISTELFKEIDHTQKAAMEREGERYASFLATPVRTLQSNTLTEDTYGTGI